MRIKSAVACILAFLIGATPSFAAHGQNAPDVWKSFAERLEAGALVRVELADGTKVKGNVIQVTGDSLRIKPKTRIPVPMRDLRFVDIRDISRQKDQLSPGAKVLAGVGVGAGAVLGMFLIFLATWD